MYRCRTMDLHLGFCPKSSMSSNARTATNQRSIVTNSKKAPTTTTGADTSKDRFSQRPQTLSSVTKRYEAESDWKPVRRGLESHKQLYTDESEEDPSNAYLQSDVNQELTDLLRSQIARLLEENEKILRTLDDYREQLTNLRREQKESAIDPTAEMMALQTALGESRLREAELTIALGELQDRIAAIDRMIETDPEMESFFNAVTISTTTLSKTQPMQRTSQCHSDSFVSREQTHIKTSHRKGTQIYKQDSTSETTCTDKRSYLKGNKYFCTQVSRSPFHANADTDTPEHSHRSGLESPQSDSGCSLNSHALSDATDQPNSFEEPEISRTRDHIFTINDPLEHEQSLEQGFDEDREFQNAYPRKAMTHLRRSRSSATEHSHASGFYSELSSPVSLLSKNNMTFCGRDFDNAPTPTESGHTLDQADTTATSQDEYKWTAGDRFSKLRASFRKSFGLGPTKPDFRIEAFAARQGEARALLSLRETRMELLRVQSRCQTLQRHMERLEAINVSRMEELEASAIGDRELRQDIRELQRRIFQLEAEHREFKVNQRIKEMELMSRLAEANLCLSHAEISNQQDSVWLELNKAHEAASELLTPTHSPPDMHQTISTTFERRHSDHRATEEVVRTRPVLEHSITLMEPSRRQQCQDQSTIEIISSNRPPTRGRLSIEPNANSYPEERFSTSLPMDQSLGSLSDLRLQPDLTITSRLGNKVDRSSGHKS